MAKQTARQCKICHFAWFAVPAKFFPADKPRWFDENISFTGNSTARMTRRAANYDRHQAAVDDRKKCPNCGSRKLKTPRDRRSFQPTGRLVQQPVAPVAAPPTFVPQPSASPWAPSAARSGSATAQSPGFDWEPLKRWYLRHWRLLWAALFAVAPFTTLGDGSTYTHAAWLNVLQFVGTLVATWCVAACFFMLHRRRKQSPRAASSR